MKIKLITSLCLLLPLVSMAQSSEQMPLPIYVIKTNSKTEIITSNLFIDPQNISSLRFMTHKEGKRRFGKKNEHALISIVTPKPNVKLLTLGEFFRIHNVVGSSQKTPLRIDDENIADTTRLIICENSISNVKVRADSIVVLTNNHKQYLIKHGLYHE